MKLIIQNQTCHLLKERAVYWEEEQAIILADIHIGKGAVFRKAGIPIPQGIGEDDLKEIEHLIHSRKAKKCIIVGDLIHAKNGMTTEVIARFSDWLNKNDCEVHLILGNHDRALKDSMPPEWPVNVYHDGLLLEPFYFSHEPMRVAPWFVWSGHIHPKVEISNKYDSIVLRCFQIFKDLAILPSFGFFTGGALVKKSARCKIYAIADEHVIEI